MARVHQEQTHENDCLGFACDVYFSDLFFLNHHRDERHLPVGRGPAYVLSEMARRIASSPPLGEKPWMLSRQICA